MNTRQATLHPLAGGAPTAARLIAIEDPPVARPDIELSTPPCHLELSGDPIGNTA
jgi:hypothetical protein